jgi:hypothetical protein
MIIRLSALTLLLTLLWPSNSQGQTFQPDTSLSYARFLVQARDFSQNPQDQLWVVHFWASWDGGSLATLPRLRKLFEGHLDKPVRYVGVSSDYNRSAWVSAIKRYQLPWEQLRLENSEDYEFLKTAFPHNSLPGLFVVDRQARIQRLRNIEELNNYLATETRALPNQPFYQANPSSPGGSFSSQEANEDAEYNTYFDEPDSQTTGEGDVEDGWLIHRVKKGDTLYGLQRQYDVPVSTLKNNNRLTNNTIKIGQVLRIRPI